MVKKFYVQGSRLKSRFTVQRFKVEKLPCHSRPDRKSRKNNGCPTETLGHDKEG
jgi:hypothetical protein